MKQRQRKEIYLDAAATTAVTANVRRAMDPWLGLAHDAEPAWGNPSALHARGQKARVAVERARRSIAQALQVNPAHLTFTSGATEANNLILQGRFFAVLAQRGLEAAESFHLITSESEHSSVRKPAEFLRLLGAEVTYLRPNNQGVIATEQLAAALEKGAGKTQFISLMLVNNETGVISPWKAFADLASQYEVPLHMDAVQALKSLDMGPITTHPGVTALSFSAHKVGGPQGAGLLWNREPMLVRPLTHGGGQERDLRSGTEAVGLIIGAAQAYVDAIQGITEHRAISLENNQALLQAFENNNLDFVLHAKEAERIPSILNVEFPGLDAQSLLITLDMAGIAASTGSACSAGGSEESAVLKAMGLSTSSITSTVRFSFDGLIAADDFNHVAETIKNAL